MFSSIFRPSRSKRRRPRADSSPFAPLFRNATPPRNERFGGFSSHEEEEEDDDEETEDSSSEEALPLLPIFDASVLDHLPVFALTHTIRLLVTEKCETVLSWEQLRSPQVSQFLVKPIQQEIRTNSFSAATIYALMANCLQFAKEIDLQPGNSGTSSTRALICELLAIKLLREYSTRELIDALSYDFDPLQGQSDPVIASTSNARENQSRWQQLRNNQSKTARISCLEIAIRAQAKRFLSHPLVVQQLQAIWNGSIVFHNAADSMHRRGRPHVQQLTYGTNATEGRPKQRSAAEPVIDIRRKMVTLYNPRDASLFKLSRLRVPRYRTIISTMSYAVLLSLFVAVLMQRSVEITVLEVIFWFWAAGYMLDEVVGFNEQGFGLYIASFWNTFDLGILLLLVVHLCLRIYGIVSPAAHKRTTAYLAYDILAASAILLFPRFFSVLDHYRYFSQLIIAFRLMAADLMAVCILILIACSGFFVALSLSFGDDRLDDPQSVGFALLQLLLGFTPAAWDRWDSYTPLGRAILVLFMFITHFVVVTILITVLTNSFMAVVKNANEEHQFLFAVNTISSVKSDSLFSYVPPLNVLQWLLTPLKFLLPFRQFVYWNRTVIKITHLPILFSIYLYEKTVLQSSIIDSIDMVESQRRVKRPFARRLPRLVRAPSMATFKQDQALEEVFKQPMDDTVRTAFGNTRRKSTLAVSRWMNEMGEGTANPPEEQDQKVVKRLERRRTNRRQVSIYTRRSDPFRRTMSVASDPADIASHPDFVSPMSRITPSANATVSQLHLASQQDDGDGDDELLTNDGLEDDAATKDPRDSESAIAQILPFERSPQLVSASRTRSADDVGLKVFGNRPGLVSRVSGNESVSRLNLRPETQPSVRKESSSTMVFNPIRALDNANLIAEESDTGILRLGKTPSGILTPRSKPNSSSTAKRTVKGKTGSDSRPTLPDKNHPAFRSTPNVKGLLALPRQQSSKQRSSLEMDLVSDIGDNKALGGGYIGAIPASFANQMALASGGLQQLQQERQEEQERLSRLVMARMNSLEEGFREIIHEMRESKKTGGVAKRSRSSDRIPRTPPQNVREKDKKKARDVAKSRNNSGTATSVEGGPSRQQIPPAPVVSAEEVEDQHENTTASTQEPSPQPISDGKD